MAEQGQSVNLSPLDPVLEDEQFEEEEPNWSLDQVKTRTLSAKKISTLSSLVTLSGLSI